DAITVNYSNASFADKNVGAARTVTVSGITITGPDADDYTYNTTASTTADITPRALAVTLTGGGKVYDGTTAATATFADADRVPGDVLTVNYASALFDSKNVGSAKPVFVTGITVTGPDAGNYAYKNEANTAADIGYRNLNVVFSGGNKVYDGITLATVTPGDD